MQACIFNPLQFTFLKINVMYVVLSFEKIKVYENYNFA